MTEAISTFLKEKLTHGHWLVAGSLLIASGIALSLHPSDAEATRPDNLDQSAVSWGGPLPLELPPAISLGADPAGVAADSSEVATQWQTVKIKQGDNLSSIFARLGISPQMLHTILALGKEASSLKRIRPGQIIKLKLAEQSQLLELIYDMDPTRSLHIWQEDADNLKSAMIERPVERRPQHASGVISSSLFESALQAGMSDNLTMELAGIFGWDIDFALDIREGDRFSVVYDDLYVDGNRLRHGDILAAEFVNDGTTYRALRYTDPSGRTDYYSPDGKSMRKAFLRTPVEFSRISSRFSTGRYHPILNRIRAHKGVDYAAPTGTPVRATGDGKVQFAGTKGGYGKAIALQHGSRYSTLYGHLSRFAKGIRPGARVHQGQVIGYVGMTGLATGPHLHYEFQINGVHRNPLTARFPDAAPVATPYKQDFITASRRILAQLDTLNSASSVALNDR